MNQTETTAQSISERTRLELSVKAKNGVNFIAAAVFIWLLLGYIWMLDFPAKTKGVYSFYAAMPLLPLAWLFSKIMKTSWTIKGNPIQDLGLWLNFAQLFYFPFLVLVLMRFPEYFLSAYGIVLGAHFFPYSWFYKVKSYMVMAGVISIGSMVLGLMLPYEKTFWIGFYVSACLLVLCVLLYAEYLSNKRRYEQG